MTDIRLDLSDSANWDEVYSVSRTVEPLANGYRPIGEIQVPILLENQFLAAYTESATANPRWKSAGFLNQKLGLGITVGGLPDAIAASGRRCLLKKIVLVQWQILSSSYAIIFEPHYWLEDISFRLWRYTGPIASEVEERIDLTRIDLLRIEKKVNTLFDRD